MKRIMVMLAVLFLGAGMAFSQTAEELMLSEMEGVITGAFQSVASNMANNLNTSMQTYIGAGNVYPMDTSPFFGLKVGAGVGVNVSGYLVQYAQDPAALEELFAVDPAADPDATNINAIVGPLGAVLGVVPMPYDMVYAKIGLPEGLLSFLPFLKNTDVGVRIGILPNIGDFIGSFGDDNASVTFSTGGFHLGVEARSLLLGKPKGVLTADLRVSFDMDFGHVGATANVTWPMSEETNAGTFSADIVGDAGLNFKWRGTALGFKLMGGVNLRLIQLYGGVGLTFNVGSVISEMYLRAGAQFEDLGFRADVIDWTEESRAAFDFAEVTAIAGVKLFGFFMAGVEYSITRHNVAVTIVPVCLAF